MGMDGIGSSVVVALAAVLWLVYLIPTWFRRREYLSTERNAVRLQQTIRIMAETAEVPETVRLEADARTVAHQEKLLRRQYERDQAIAKAKEAAMSRAAARTLATLKPSIAAEAVMLSPAAVRLRRSRAATSAVLLVAVAAIAASFVPALATMSAILLVCGAGGAVVALALLTKMASVARARGRVATELRSRPEQPRRLVLPEPVVEQEERVVEWTPVPLPKPLYLSKPAPQPIVSEAMRAEARERLIAEAIEKERAEVVAEQAEKVTPIRPAAAVESVYARMGIVEEVDRSVTDLDAVLRRRRAV